MNAIPNKNGTKFADSYLCDRSNKKMTEILLIIKKKLLNPGIYVPLFRLIIP